MSLKYPQADGKGQEIEGWQERIAKRGRVKITHIRQEWRCINSKRGHLIFLL